MSAHLNKLTAILGIEVADVRHIRLTANGPIASQPNEWVLEVPGADYAPGRLRVDGDGRR